MIQIEKVQVPFEDLLKTVQQLNSRELEALIAQVIKVQAQRKAPSLSQDQSLTKAFLPKFKNGTIF